MKKRENEGSVIHVWSTGWTVTRPREVVGAA